MALPRYSTIENSHFCVGFGPRGVRSRLILTQVRADRLAGCDGLVTVKEDPSISRVDQMPAPDGSRYKKYFRIPWALRSEEDVQMATRKTLRYATESLAPRIVFTPLGVGEDSIISPAQSARAMLGAIYALWSGTENTVPSQILISVHADSTAYQNFESALKQYFFPHRQAENPNSGLRLRGAIRRWGARTYGKNGQNLSDCLKALDDNLNRDIAARNILKLAKEQPEIFKAKDIDRMSAYVSNQDKDKGILETLLILRMRGGRVGEAARMALVTYETTAATDVVRDEMKLIAEADEAELAKAIPIERARFLETLSPDPGAIDVNAMCSGEDSTHVRCNYDALWERTGMISWGDDSGQIHRQFIRFHIAEPVTRSRMKNYLFSMGMRVANRQEATRILEMLKIAVLERYGRGANRGSHLLDGTQEWFLNLCAEYRNHSTAFDSDSHVASLPERIGRGTLYLHFQNHAEADRDSHRFLRILAEDFGLTFVSPRES